MDSSTSRTHHRYPPHPCYTFRHTQRCTCSEFSPSQPRRKDQNLSDWMWDRPGVCVCTELMEASHLGWPDLIHGFSVSSTLPRIVVLGVEKFVFSNNPHKIVNTPIICYTRIRYFGGLRWDHPSQNPVVIVSSPDGGHSRRSTRDCQHSWRRVMDYSWLILGNFPYG